MFSITDCRSVFPRYQRCHTAVSRGDFTRVYNTIDPGGAERPTASHRQLLPVAAKLRQTCAVTTVTPATGSLSAPAVRLSRRGAAVVGAGCAGGTGTAARASAGGRIGVVG